jgi:hypothetical protein
MSDENVIDKNWSFYVQIEWWEILLVLISITFTIYFIRKRRKIKSAYK